MNKNSVTFFLLLTVTIVAAASRLGAASTSDSPVAAGAAALKAGYNVSTVAGAGTSGVLDGDPRTAQFMKPIGIAVDGGGNIFVADAAAQRIRKISPSGDVTTIGGSGPPMFNSMWVLGGYKDGPALQSQFNRPSGVAIAPDGTVYVADTLNHCIRAIKNGIVSTFAGAPDRVLDEDGPLAKAAFIRPRALAFNAAGDLFVADEPIGVRKISDGIVSTVALPIERNAQLLSIAFTGSAQEIMVVGTASELLAFNKDGTVLSRQAVTRNGGADEILFGRRGVLNKQAMIPETLGVPMGLAAFPDGHVVYADARSHALRSAVLSPAAEPAAQGFPTPQPDAADYGGGYRDGPLGDALFDAPMGVARLPDGSIVVADTGNRRIRKLTAGSTGLVRQDTSAPIAENDDNAAGRIVVAGEDPFPGVPTSYYRIAYLGNSFAFYNTRWADSIPGLVEAGLGANWRAEGFPKPPKFVCIAPIKGLSGFRDYIDNILSLGVVDAVILQLNATNIGETFPAPHSETYDYQAYAKTWMSPTQQFVVDMNTELKKAAIPLVVVVTPTAPRLSSLEESVASEVMAFPDFLYLDYGPPNGDTFEADIKDVVDRSHVPSIFLQANFLQAEQDANRLPLFGTMDGHFSKNGRKLAAKVIVKALLQMHFWRATK